MARRGKDGQGEVWQAGLGLARQGGAWRVMAGEAWLGTVRLGVVWQAGHGLAGPGLASYGRQED